MIPISYQQKRFHKHIWSWNHMMCPLRPTHTLWEGPAHTSGTPCWCLCISFFYWDRPEPPAPCDGGQGSNRMFLNWPKYPSWQTAGHVIIHREREKGWGGFERFSPSGDSSHVARNALVWRYDRATYPKRHTRAQEMPRVFPHNNDFFTSTVS